MRVSGAQTNIASLWKSISHRHLDLINHLGHAWGCPCSIRRVLNGLPRGGMSSERHFAARRLDLDRLCVRRGLPLQRS